MQKTRSDGCVRQRCHGRVSRPYMITSCGPDTRTESGESVEPRRVIELVVLLLSGILGASAPDILLALASSATEDRPIEYKMCVLVYKCLHQTAPIYLSELCIPVATSAGRSHLRSAVKGCLVISYCRTKNYGQRSFSYSGPTLWNSLPLTVRDPSISVYMNPRFQHISHFPPLKNKN